MLKKCNDVKENYLVKLYDVIFKKCIYYYKNILLKIPSYLNQSSTYKSARTLILIDFIRSLYFISYAYRNAFRSLTRTYYSTIKMTML